MPDKENPIPAAVSIESGSYADLRGGDITGSYGIGLRVSGGSSANADRSQISGRMGGVLATDASSVSLADAVVWLEEAEVPEELVQDLRASPDKVGALHRITEWARKTGNATPKLNAAIQLAESAAKYWPFG